MMSCARWSASGVWLLALCLVSSASARISPSSPSVLNSPGSNPNHGPLAFLPGESVDPLSGGLSLVQTDLTLPGNAGFNLAVTRTYSSKIFPGWEAGDSGLVDPSWVGLGWRLHFGRVVREHVTWAPGVTAIEMGDGSEHPLWDTPDVPEGWITSDFWRYDRPTRTEAAERPRLHLQLGGRRYRPRLEGLLRQRDPRSVQQPARVQLRQVGGGAHHHRRAAADSSARQRAGPDGQLRRRPGDVHAPHDDV